MMYEFLLFVKPSNARIKTFFFHIKILKELMCTYIKEMFYLGLEKLGIIAL